MAARHFVVAVVLLLLATTGMAPTPDALGAPQNAPPGSAANPQIDLQDTLDKGLKARRPAEFAFDAKVVNLVNQGVLPETLVRSTFLWARRQSLKFPFPYFQQAMTLRARKIGVSM
ncbi:MAG: hypothetical protein ACYC35_28450 [Pirellulales bacterium]|jgi:hypothetical protein